MRLLVDSTSNTPKEETKDMIKPEKENSDISNSDSDLPSSDREYDPTLDQFAQDPNADDDSGMSFDSEALHNLDTIC